MFENKLLQNINPYKLSSHKAWEVLGSNGVLKLDWNESTIDPSPRVFSELLRVIDTGKLNWYPNTNNESLRKKIAEYVGIAVANIQYFASSDALHEYILRAFMNEEESVLIVNPTYDNFRAVGESVSKNVFSFNLDSNFMLDVKELSNEILHVRPKLVYIVNPNNPTGTLHEIEKIRYLLKKHPFTLFIIDEAYFEFSNVSSSLLCSTYNNIIVSRTFSKAFGLASFRVGYAISCSQNIEVLNKIRNPKNVSLLAQVAAEAALDDVNYMQEYVRVVNTAKGDFFNYLVNFSQFKIHYGSGNFLFVEAKSQKLKDDLIKHLENNNVFVRDYGHLAQTQKHFRITIGTIDQMAIVKKHMSEFMDHNDKKEYLERSLSF